MKITLFTTHCPRCSVLEKKLNNKNISFDIVEDKEEMIRFGFTAVPILKVDEKMFNFNEAIKWINEVEV